MECVFASTKAYVRTYQYYGCALCIFKFFTHPSEKENET